MESLVIVEGDSFIFDGVSAGFSARLKFVAIAGGVAIIRVLIFRAVSEGDVLFIVGINGESAAGESVFKDIFLLFEQVGTVSSRLCCGLYGFIDLVKLLKGLTYHHPSEKQASVVALHL